jgi:hypothetical protein
MFLLLIGALFIWLQRCNISKFLQTSKNFKSYAVPEMNLLEVLKSSLKSWFLDAKNGLTSFYLTGQRSGGFQDYALKQTLHPQQHIPKTASLTCKQ